MSTQKNKISISILTPSIRPEGLAVTQNCLKEQTFTDFEWLQDIGLGNKHDLNQAWNRMLRRANGELVVFLQDYIKIEPDGLQKFWEAYQANPNTMFTSAVGKTDNFACVNPIWDWRKERIGEIEYQECEMDFGASPIKTLQDIGGFDEELDNYWSMDNISVCKRAKMIGCKFMCIDNPAIAYDHDARIVHPFRKDFNPTMSNLLMEYENPKLPYL